MTLEWLGDEVYARVVEAAVGATEATVDDAIADTQADTPVLTGAAKASVRREGGGLDIAWGYHVAYGLFIEVGDLGRAGVHAMRRAADKHYARLASRIAERVR